MRISFDYPHEIFRFAKQDYDPEYVIQTIIEKCEKLADLYDLFFSHSKKVYFDYEIKQSDIYCVQELRFSRDDISLNLTFEIVIPDIRNSFCTISGVRRYVQKQLRDSVFIYLKVPTRIKVLTEFHKTLNLSYLQKAKKFTFNIQGFPHVNAIALYLALLGENEDEKLSDLNNPVIDSELNDFLLNERKDLLRIKSLPNDSSYAQKKRTLNYVKVYYEMSDVLQEYFKSPSDIILQMFSNIEVVDIETGLDIRNRRIRNTNEMITYNFLSYIVDYILEALFISNKTKRQKHVKLEPFQGLYDFVLAENTFDAPLASVSNRGRCTLLGEGGFSRQGVPVRIKDLHPSQFNCLCPAVTPDRDNAGVVLYLASTCELDHIGRFKIDTKFLDIMLKGATHESTES